MSSKYLAILKEKFGFNEFRDPQEKIINYLIKDKKDVLAIMPTGKGKSLCYLFPPVYLKKTAIIVSPLISLQDDQCMGLIEKEIPAVVLNSNLKGSKRSVEMTKILDNLYRIVFMTPEFISGNPEFLQEMNEKNKPCLIAIDEAHSISTWGHDFRIEYRNLKSLKVVFPDIPTIAVTATATPQVKDDIKNQLCLINPIILTTSFDRPNIFITVKEKNFDTISVKETNEITGKTKNKDKVIANIKKDIIPLLDMENSNIIYTITRKEAEEINDLLFEEKIKSAVYHAGLSDKKRKEVHHQFIHDEIKVIIGTIAFGMGIDKPNIRNVIVYGCPSDIETMYQEIGRAGRDTLPSSAYIFYCTKDFVMNKLLIDKIGNTEYKNSKMTMKNKMEKMLKIQTCRRKYILDYFGKTDIPNVPVPADQCCDNCKAAIQHEKENSRDYTKERNLLVGLCEKVSLGSTKLINILQGSDTIKPEHKKLIYFGKGKDHSNKWWKSFTEVLVDKGHLAQKSIPNFTGFVLNANKTIEFEGNFLIVPTQEMIKEEQLPVVIKGHVEEEQLRKALIKLRDEYAEKLKIPPHNIIPDNSIIGLCKNKPLLEKDLIKIDGITLAIVKKYGKEIVQIIKDYNSFNQTMSNFH